ncbi:MAG TPA: NUDIX domain-containing protein [Rhizomicrobium sp.]|nr:NUDIX domain-containing protein [Rhizomicrobium sp.]
MSHTPQRFPLDVTALVMAARTVVNPTAFGATAIVEDGQGRVLLVRHTYMSDWRLPGGGVGRGEPPDVAVMRELEEEVNLLESTAPEFLALYTRRVLWFSNVVALYRVRNARIDFKRNIEVRAAKFFDPKMPPPGTAPGSRRRLAEFYGDAARGPYW